MKILKIAFVSISALIFTQLTAAAEATLGGSLESTVVATVDDSENTLLELWNRAGVEFVFPPSEKTSARFDVDIFGSRGESDFFIRSLYIRRRFEMVHVTLGRQPVSWNFGSLINPVDFTLGSEIAGEERMAKFSDAVELYVPLGWSAGLSAVASFSSYTDDVKGAFRIRSGLGSFDLSANFVHEPAGILPSRNEILNRLGLSAKGDLGPVGFYGAAGGIWDDDLSKEPQLTGLAGMDCSFSPRRYRQVYVQLEYLSLAGQITSDVLGSGNGKKEKNTELLGGNINYGVDEFTSLGLSAFIFASSGDTVLSPYMESDLGNDLLLTIRGGWLGGDSVSIFGQTVFEDEIKSVKGILQGTLSYSF